MGDDPPHGSVHWGFPTQGSSTDNCEAARRLLEWIWEYPSLETATQEAGFEEMKAYVKNMQNTVTQYIAT